MQNHNLYLCLKIEFLNIFLLLDRNFYLRPMYGHSKDINQFNLQLIVDKVYLINRWNFLSSNSFDYNIF